jgi:hypothetical protein
MSQSSLANLRIVDPILSAVARGYASPQAPVAEALFPFVYVGARAGKIVSFGPDDFKKVSTSRAPGANTKRVQFGYSGLPFALSDHSLEGVVPKENMQEAAAVPGIDLASGAVRTVQNLMGLERETQAAAIALTAGNYASSNKVTLTGTDRWDDPASDPFGDINAGRQAIRSQTGVKPNKLVLGPKVLSALRSNPKVLGRLSTAADQPPATLAQLQALFEIDEVVEGGSVYFDEATNLFVDVWGTYAVLAYTAPKSMQERGSPSYGYTYRLNGMPLVEEPYTERNPKSWFYPVTDAYQAVLASAAAGFLFTSAVS